MYTTISIFYASFLVMILMIVLKSRRLARRADAGQVRTGNPNIISRTFARSDDFFSNIFISIRQAISYINKHTFISLAQWIAYHILRHIRAGYVEVKHRALENPHTRKVIDMVRGRGEVKKHGASIYLKRISNDQ